MKALKHLKHLTLALVAGVSLAVIVPRAEAQVTLSIGAEPSCPYGFYDYEPYTCAPSGYYGPEWFLAGAFIGAGPWFHGPERFRGSVDEHFDGRHGYRGPFPYRGDRPDFAVHGEHMARFRGNATRSGGGHEGGNR